MLAVIGKNIIERATGLAYKVTHVLELRQNIIKPLKLIDDVLVGITQFGCFAGLLFYHVVGQNDLITRIAGVRQTHGLAEIKPVD